MLVQFQILGFMYPVYDSQVTRPYSSHSALQLQKYLHMYKLYMLFVLILSLLFKTTSTYKSVALILSLLSRITSTWLTSCLCNPKLQVFGSHSDSAIPNYKSLIFIKFLFSKISVLGSHPATDYQNCSTTPWFSSCLSYPDNKYSTWLSSSLSYPELKVPGSHHVSPIQISSTWLSSCLFYPELQVLGSHPVSSIQITSTVLGSHPVSPIQNYKFLPRILSLISRITSTWLSSCLS